MWRPGERRSGRGDGGSGRVSVSGFGGMCRILNEKRIEPSVKSEVSGKEEKALGSA
jgi:hypothetical protein